MCAPCAPSCLHQHAHDSAQIEFRTRVSRLANSILIVPLPMYHKQLGCALSIPCNAGLASIGQGDRHREYAIM